MNNKAEYTPEKVVDISNLSREDWLEYRKKGIGGSDVAAIMGISPFATIRDLFYNKTGVQPVIQEEEESNWVAKEVGHRLEDLVAEIFSKKTGLEVFPVRVMFRHPLYPFMLADVDFFVRMPDGTFAILECKTLIFAVDDAHADMITQILKDYYTNLGISEEAVMKITGSIENGNPVKIKEAIRRFKNETYPNIVVTVDLLTTGIDVEEIVNLVFMRRIRSRILFEQMLGRATRLCPEIGKTHFEIYDAVGVYNALEPVSTMKPVVANPATTFDDLIDGIDSLDTDRARANQIDLIVAKMRRNKSQMSDEYRTQFEQLSGGMTPEEFIEKIHSMPVDEAIVTVKNNRAALEYVRRMPKEREKFISDEPDELRSHARGYGDATRPEDYLKEFRDFIDNNMNEIAALNIVATRPKELTRQSLKELKIILDGKHFNETMLQTAWKEMTNEDIAADIISFIRQRSIGDALISKDDRIHNAIVKTKANHPELSKIQLGWLDRIEAQLLKEVVLNRETFDSDAFKNKGGYNAVNKAFGQKLDEFIDEINGYMYSA